MSRNEEIMSTTVDLVSAYMNSLDCKSQFIGDFYAKQYAEFIEIIYRKVEELTATE